MTQPRRLWTCLLDITLLLAIGSIASIGCQPANPPAAPAVETQVTATAAPANQDAFGEFWDVMFIQGNRVGYTHTTVAPHEESGRELVKFVSESRWAIVRYGEKNEQSFEFTTIETPGGELVRFATQTAFGPAPMDTTGQLNTASGKLEITTTAGGREISASLAWPDGCRGIFGSEQSLREQPMKAGDRRTFPMLVPIINQIATVNMVARGKESTPLLGGETQELMRIDSTTLLPDGNEIDLTIWTTDAGETLKTRTEAMQQETYRTTKQVAMSETAAPDFDLGLNSMIRIEPAIKNAHGTKRVRYRIELEGGDPAKVFANSGSQSAKSVSEHVAELTVTSIGPNSKPRDAKQPSEPSEGDLAANSLVQSDDARIAKLAKEATAAISGDWNVALALEKFVHQSVEKKNFSQAFASAAEVAESREGDCTEHAVLLAALLRARGIPARVAIGLVYVEPSQAFGYHMWTEAFVNGHWIPLDATLGRGGIGGAHLKLLSTNLAGASAYSSFLPVAKVLGRLKIEVLEAE